MRVWRFLLVTAMVTLLAAPVAAQPLTRAAANDYDPPVIVSLAASPTTVAPGGTVILTAHLTDAGTGVDGSTMQVGYAPPTANSAIAYSFTLSMGNDQDGIWVATLTVPAVANSGTWTLYYFFASDKVGNSLSIIPSNNPCVLQSIGNDFYVDNSGAIPAPFPKVMCNGTQDGSSGPADGGNSVTIRGVDFTAGATVTFGATPATSVTFVSRKELTVIVPRSSQANVSVDVTVKNPDNQVRKAPFQYQYQAFSTPITPATVTASPNPVPVGQTITTITWNTGNGSVGTVCVSDNSQAEAVFDGGSTSHTVIAPFINSGSYVFTLYGGGSCGGTKLASVTVTKQVPNTPAAPIMLSFTTSTTNLVRSYTVTFDSGDGSVVQVMLSVNGDTERLFTQSQFGSVTAPWIFSGIYSFRIVKAGRTIGTITVGTTAQISSPNGTTAGGPSPNVNTTNGTPVLLTFDTGNGQPAALCTQFGGLVSFSQNGAGFASVNNPGTVIYDLHIGACSGPTVAGPLTVTSA